MSLVPEERLGPVQSSTRRELVSNCRGFHTYQQLITMHSNQRCKTNVVTENTPHLLLLSYLLVTHQPPARHIDNKQGKWQRPRKTASISWQ